MSVLLASAAHGQVKPEIQTGSRIPVDPKAMDQKAAGVIRKQFAQCVYRSATRKVAALLDQSDVLNVNLSAANIKSVGPELDMDACLGREVGVNELALGMRFPVTALRDLMAEEAYLARYKVGPPSEPAPELLNTKFISTSPALDNARALTELVDCTLQANLPGADALVRTVPGSDREHDAAVALAPALGGCLAKGQRVNLNPGTIRAFMAYGLWNRFVRTIQP